MGALWVTRPACPGLAVVTCTWASGQSMSCLGRACWHQHHDVTQHYAYRESCPTVTRAW